MTENSNAHSLLKAVANAKACDAKTLAVIAAQFIDCGENEEEALRKANALYVKASAYTKDFASLPPDKKAIEVFGEEALAELGDREDLEIGDSEASSPALNHFRETATTKLDRHMKHKKFLEIVERHLAQKAETFGPGIEKREIMQPPTRLSPAQVEHLHVLVRRSRSRARAERRKKNPVKENRRKPRR